MSVHYSCSPRKTFRLAKTLRLGVRLERSWRDATETSSVKQKHPCQLNLLGSAHCRRPANHMVLGSEHGLFSLSNAPFRRSISMRFLPVSFARVRLLCQAILSINNLHHNLHNNLMVISSLVRRDPKSFHKTFRRTLVL